jgi:hypothetical protein
VVLSRLLPLGNTTDVSQTWWFPCASGHQWIMILPGRRDRNHSRTEWSVVKPTATISCRGLFWNPGASFNDFEFDVFRIVHRIYKENIDYIRLY